MELFNSLNSSAGSALRKSKKMDTRKSSVMFKNVSDHLNENSEESPPQKRTRAYRAANKQACQFLSDIYDCKMFEAQITISVDRLLYSMKKLCESKVIWESGTEDAIQ